MPWLMETEAAQKPEPVHETEPQLTEPQPKVSITPKLPKSSKKKTPSTQSPKKAGRQPQVSEKRMNILQALGQWPSL